MKNQIQTALKLNCPAQESYTSIYSKPAPALTLSEAYPELSKIASREIGEDGLKDMEAKIVALAIKILTKNMRTKGIPLDTPSRVKIYAKLHLQGETIEKCQAFFVDSQFRLISYKTLSVGTLTQASVYPREVIKAGLAEHAAALILVHNHPSGVGEASEADLALTRHLKSALALVDIRLLDHLIVAGEDVVSMAERGQI